MEYIDVDIDLEKRIARMIIPLYTVIYKDNPDDDPDHVANYVRALSTTPNMILVIEGSKIDVKARIDFGFIVPEFLWTFGDDTNYGEENNKIKKGMILESIKINSPDIIEKIRVSVQSYINEFYGKTGDNNGSLES